SLSSSFSRPMADPAESLFVSLRTTAGLTSNSDDAFSQLLHQLNAVLNVRATGGSPTSEMHRAAVGELFECISRNERSMYGDAKNIAFLNFAKSFAALSDSAQNLFDPLSPHCATVSEASPRSGPPRLYPANRDVYQMLHDERDYDQVSSPGLLVDASMDNSSLDGEYGGRLTRRSGLLSPRYRTSSPMYDYEAKAEEVEEERDLLDDPRATPSQHDATMMISALFGPVVAASTPKAPPAKKQKMTTPKVDPPEYEVCPYCVYQSTCAAHVTKHVRIDHPSVWLDFANIGCRLCDYRCRSNNTLKKHSRLVHGDTWQQWVSQRRLSFPIDAACPFCSEPTEDIHSLCQHVIKQHLNDVNKQDPYIGCDGCDETFIWGADLYAHWTRHHSPCPGYVRLRELKTGLRTARETTVEEEEDRNPE
ncbi:hypothetical protein PENTCL1PPCAC_25014, partial [Pristionchus entomophagus]